MFTGSMDKRLEISGVPAGGVRITYLRKVSFLLICILPMLLMWESMRTLLALAFENDTYSHIPLIPVVTCFLIYMERRAIFSRTSYGWGAGSALMLSGVMSLLLTRSHTWQFSSTNQLSFLMVGLVLVWMGAFVAFFGTRAFRAASFPLLFLLFAIPIPEPALSDLILLLQKGSADAASAIFKLFGVPVFRQGFEFALPGVTIRVAEECSGIRSTLALFITAVLAAHLWIRSTAGTLLLGVLVFPIAILKNGMRIAVLSCLAVYVDPSFLKGRLHHYGGIPFFVLGLLMLGLAMSLMQRWQRSQHLAQTPAS